MSHPARIPKRIHYCWLGGGEFPELNARCIETWKSVLPDYELVCWDRERFDVESVPFVREAVSVGAWAFAADYIRLHALATEGGIYLDSDVEVFKPFDSFLHHGAFSGIEHWPEIKTIGIEGAIVGAEKGNAWIKRCLDYYRDRRFLDEDGNRDETIVSGIIASIAAKDFGFRYELARQDLDAGICIYPPEVFTHTGGRFSQEETVALHHCAGSWRTSKPPIVQRIVRRIRKIFAR